MYPRGVRFSRFSQKDRVALTTMGRASTVPILCGGDLLWTAAQKHGQIKRITWDALKDDGIKYPKFSKPVRRISPEAGNPTPNTNIELFVPVTNHSVFRLLYKME